MKMTRILACALGVVLASAAWADRIIPNSMNVARLQSAEGRQVVLSDTGWSWLKVLTLGWLNGSRDYTLSASARVRNQQNLFVTYSNLPRYAGEAVAVRFSANGQQIQEIWILTPAERAQLEERAKRMQK